MVEAAIVAKAVLKILQKQIADVVQRTEMGLDK